MVLLSGCGPREREYELDSKNFDSKTLQMIQTDTRIVLPASARGLHFYYKPPIDPAYLAKIEIPRDSKEKMTQSVSSITGMDIHTDGSFQKRVSWWIPKSAKVLVERQTRVGNDYLHVTLTEESDAVILYIEWVTI
jgi:hypothetical protein